MNALLLTNRNVITKTRVELNRNFSNGKLALTKNRRNPSMEKTVTILIKTLRAGSQ